MDIIRTSHKQWKLSGVDPSTLNLLRHSLLADVPVQAVDRVTFHSYNGPWESESIAHRLGQIPIRGLEPMTFDLKVECPPDKQLLWATAAEIVGGEGRIVRGDEPVFGKSSAFMLVPLLAGQKVHVTCHTSLGTGRKRTTWNSTLPVITHLDDGSNVLTVETTDAIPARDAVLAALEAGKRAFSALLT